MGMTFTNILKDTTCDCLKNAIVDTESTYGIKTNGQNITGKDFRSKWEKGEKPLDDCKTICSKKGISLSLINEKTKNDVIEIFKEIFPISPTYRPYLSVIKFYEDAGMVKCEASRRNPYHCNFYKSDTFDVNKIRQIESISLANV
jgi:hypothetical protein